MQQILKAEATVHIWLANAHRLDGTEFQVVSSTEEQVELSFRSSYNASRPNSLRLNVDKRYVYVYV